MWQVRIRAPFPRSRAARKISGFSKRDDAVDVPRVEPRQVGVFNQAPAEVGERVPGHASAFAGGPTRENAMPTLSTVTRRRMRNTSEPQKSISSGSGLRPERRVEDQKASGAARPGDQEFHRDDPYPAQGDFQFNEPQALAQLIERAQFHAVLRGRQDPACLQTRGLVQDLFDFEVGVPVVIRKRAVFDDLDAVAEGALERFGLGDSRTPGRPRRTGSALSRPSTARSWRTVYSAVNTGLS